MEFKRDIEIDRHYIPTENLGYPISSFRNLKGTCPTNSILVCLMASKKLADYYGNVKVWYSRLEKEIEDNRKKRITNGIDITSEKARKYIIMNSISDNFSCLVSNYFHLPRVISPVRFCDAIFQKSKKFNKSMYDNGFIDTYACNSGGGSAHINYIHIIDCLIYESSYKEDIDIENDREKEIAYLNYIANKITKLNITLVGDKFELPEHYKCPILELFGIYSKETSHCDTCKTKRIKYLANTLTSRSYFFEDFTFIENFGLTCQTCRNILRVESKILQLPEYLVSFCIERTTEQKINEEIINRTIDLSHYVPCERDKYSIYGFVQYTSGHFHSFVKYDFTWYHVDDARVEVLTLHQLIDKLNTLHYVNILTFYKRIN
jgi:ubiquitin C-terminal hydrolase